MAKLSEMFGKFHRFLSENRTSERRPADTEVALAWRDGRGRVTHSKGRCLDISEMGARIAYFQPIALPAVIQIRPGSDGILRTGNVLRCTPVGDHYELGIEFCDPASIRGGAKQVPAQASGHQLEDGFGGDSR